MLLSGFKAAVLLIWRLAQHAARRSVVIDQTTLGSETVCRLQTDLQEDFVRKVTSALIKLFIAFPYLIIQLLTVKATLFASQSCSRWNSQGSVWHIRLISRHPQTQQIDALHHTRPLETPAAAVTW